MATCVKIVENSLLISKPIVHVEFFRISATDQPLLSHKLTDTILIPLLAQKKRKKELCNRALFLITYLVVLNLIIGLQIFRGFSFVLHEHKLLLNIVMVFTDILQNSTAARLTQNPTRACNGWLCKMSVKVSQLSTILGEFNMQSKLHS